MIEYKGWKVFDIDYGGEHEFVAAKNMQDAINWHLNNVGDEYDEDGLEVSYLEKDFMIDCRDVGEPDELVSQSLIKTVDVYHEKYTDQKAFGVASSIY